MEIIIHFEMVYLSVQFLIGVNAQDVYVQVRKVFERKFIRVMEMVCFFVK